MIFPLCQVKSIIRTDELVSQLVSLSVSRPREGRCISFLHPLIKLFYVYLCLQGIAGSRNTQILKS